MKDEEKQIVELMKDKEFMKHNTHLFIEIKYKCVFCGKDHEGYGNSCWPIHNDEKVRCCDNCNMYIVIPERIKLAWDQWIKSEVEE